MYIPWWVLIIVFIGIISFAKDSDGRVEELESRLEDLEDRLGGEEDFDDNIDPEI